MPSLPSSDDELLILAAGTINTYDLVERFDAATQAGYAGLGLRSEDYDRTIAGGKTEGELKARLLDAGLEVWELQSVHGWAGKPEDRQSGRVIEDGCYRVADALGARYIMVSNTELVGTFDGAVEAFAAICDRADERGLQVAIEFLPWGPIPDAKTAWRLVSLSGRANCGVLIDSWHHYRGANDDEQIKVIPAERIIALQIDDAREEIRGKTLLDDTRNERLLPGEGDIDLVRFIRLMDGMGVKAPYSVEILSHHQRALPPLQAAIESARATRDILRLARMSS